MLISASALRHRLLHYPNETVVFDCRFRLGQPQGGLEDYLRQHVPTAWFLDLEKDLSSPVQVHGGRHPLPDEHELAGKLGAAGVGSQTTVVVYDDGEGMAPHAWWLIRYLGQNQVFILDGGLSAWKNAGYPVTADLPELMVPQEFPLSPHYDWVVHTVDVEDVVAGKRTAVLVDARTGARYRGEVEPLDPKAGHIPGAENAPWQDGLSNDGLWKEGALQAERFAFVPKDKEIIAYCGSGVTACVNIFAFELAGYQNVKLYAGSWSDWCSYHHLPVSVGKE